MTQFTDDQMLLSDAIKSALTQYVARYADVAADAMLRLDCISADKLTAAQIDTLITVLDASEEGSINIPIETHCLIEALMPDCE